ncbi:MAG TPA: hypothetical protein VMU06_23050 [Stellaceae bacterium]|nr:hypothetical protein [Stellaceae bacterium]
MRDDIDAFELTPWERTDEASWQRRKDNLWISPVAPLNKLVEELRRETADHVPWIDPFCGGTEAQIMAVLLRPGRLGAMATDFLSLANGDPTARNMIKALTEVGISYRKMMFWNAIPWAGEREEKITSAMREQGRAMLERLVPLLPELKSAILVGGEAQRVGKLVTWPPTVRVLECAHPGPFVWNQFRYREQKQGIFEAFRKAAALTS